MAAGEPRFKGGNAREAIRSITEAKKHSR